MAEDPSRVRRHGLKSVGLLILRLGIGGMMLTHGLGKLSGFSDMVGSFPDPIGLGQTPSLVLAIFAEFFCALLLMVGFLTRLAAVPLVINMAVAAFIVHAEDPWAKKEFALLYLVPALSLIFTGAGGFSIDALVWRRRPVGFNHDRSIPQLREIR